jgi:activator of HSP90 ATPase
MDIHRERWSIYLGKLAAFLRSGA